MLAMAALVLAAPADAAIAPSLTAPASCSTDTTVPESYTFCDDGVPNAGGLVPNIGGLSAVTVPAKYGGDGFTGLPAQAADAATVPGADATGKLALDVDISYPASGAGPFPLLVFMHGCCSGDKTSWESKGTAGTRFDAGGELWHYSNAWFASRGYVVINYTARGFVNQQNNGSTGQTQLDSRNYEINDYQDLSCQVTQLFNGSPTLPDVDPSKVVPTGGSYGGGFSWLALTDPKWNCATEGAAGVNMGLAAAAPRYGWTDLVYSLVPTGTHFGEPGNLPDVNGCDSGPVQVNGSACPAPQTPYGLPKRSILNVLFASGTVGLPPGFSAHDLRAGCHPGVHLSIGAGSRPVNSRLCPDPDDPGRVPARSLGLLPERLLRPSDGCRPRLHGPDLRCRDPHRPAVSGEREPAHDQPAAGDRPRLPGAGLLRRLSALRPEQGEGVGRHLRGRSPSLQQRRLPGHHAGRLQRRAGHARASGGHQPPQRASSTTTRTSPAAGPRIRARRASTSLPSLRSVRRRALAPTREARSSPHPPSSSWRPTR